MGGAERRAGFSQQKVIPTNLASFSLFTSVCAFVQLVIMRHGNKALTRRSVSSRHGHSFFVVQYKIVYSLIIITNF